VSDYAAMRPNIKIARMRIDAALVIAGKEQPRGDHRHLTWRKKKSTATRYKIVKVSRIPVVIVPENKTLSGMFRLSLFEHLCELGRYDLIQAHPRLRSIQ